jgi:Protein of unknown function (DUF2971)
MLLYKYLAPDRVPVLESLTIRFTQPGALNDPFDVKPHITEVISSGSEFEEQMDSVLANEMPKLNAALAAESGGEITPEIADILSNYVRTVGKGNFERLAKQMLPTVRSLFHDTINRFIGVLSLSEDPLNLLMWSHYGQSHQGFVLGFDSAHAYFNQKISDHDEFRHLRQIEYRNERPTGPLNAMDGVTVFVVKSSAWQYEREWRMLLPLEHASQRIETEKWPIYLFGYPADAVKEVILGASIAKETRGRVIAAALTSGVLPRAKLLQAQLPDAEFGMSAIEIAI